MAAPEPTRQKQDTGASQEAKPDSCAGAKSSLPIPEELRWVWGILKDIVKELARFGQWCTGNPLGALAIAGIVATIVFFYGIFHPFFEGYQSTAVWAYKSWNDNQAYGALVPWIALGLFWYHRDHLRKAVPGGGAFLGLVSLVAGILIFIVGTRCLQPRFAMASFSFLLYGAIRYVWGKAPARVVFFPCVFLLFMIPVGALEQATSNLQFLITGGVGALSHLFGIAILAIGTTLTATDGSFNFEIAEGCSGIRSITAMTMLTAVFVHLTQDRLWKKGIIFGCSLLFSIIGNTGRIFTIVLVAKYYDSKFAAGLYHDYSGFVFFPIALVAMLGFSKLVNFDFRKLAARSLTKGNKPVSYDY